MTEQINPTPQDQDREPEDQSVYNTKLQVTVHGMHYNMLKELAQLSGCNVSATANFAIRDWLIANYEKLWKLYGGDL
jgi:post-segregation antitoxin (ccd killing protein)|tara:strand:- start:209 stop:439 length:231 start_codon:yes stop_codon:yes gene_type:complete